MPLLSNHSVCLKTFFVFCTWQIADEVGAQGRCPLPDYILGDRITCYSCFSFIRTRSNFFFILQNSWPLLWYSGDSFSSIYPPYLSFNVLQIVDVTLSRTLTLIPRSCFSIISFLISIRIRPPNPNPPLSLFLREAHCFRADARGCNWL